MDGSGQLSIDELNMAFKHIFPSMGPKEMAEYMGKVDNDGLAGSTSASPTVLPSVHVQTWLVLM